MSSARRIRTALTALLLAAAVPAAAGCGVGAGKSAVGNQLLVTADYGRETIVREDQPKVSGQDTVMRLLQRNAPNVETRYGGNFVQSIGGKAGGQRDGRSYDWFFYVNGILAEEGAGAIRLHDGDRVWFDFHDWTFADTIPAVVGAFPEPFLSGVEGKKLPTRIECERNDDNCQAVQDRLVDYDLPASKGNIGASYITETLRILVGSWPAIRRDPISRLIEAGPRRSGIFAKPIDDGRRLQLFDERGRVTRTLGPGTGLIAATRVLDDMKAQPVWIVTGTDEAGIAAAAAALDEGALAGRFAVAVIDGKPVPLPDRP
jgi:hypothetical protein